MSDGIRIVRSSIARVIGLLVSIAASFFVMPMVVRTLGDHWYGLWVIAAGMGNYYYLLDFGLSSAASRYIAARVAARDEHGVNEVVTTSLVVFTLLGLLVAAATVGVAVLAGRYASPRDIGTLRTILLLQGFGLAVGFPVKAYGGIVFSQLRYDLIEMYGLLRLVGETAAVVYVLTHGYGVVAYAVVSVASAQFYNVLFYQMANRLWPRLRVRIRYFNTVLTREIFRYSVWSMVNQISDNLRFKVDALVVGGSVGAAMVTHYNIGWRLSDYTLSLINRATNFLAPLYTRYFVRGDFDEIQTKMLAFTRINALLALGGGGVLIVVGDAFITRWMGPAYRDAYPVLVVLVIGMMAEAILQPASNVLYALSRHRAYAVGAAVEAAANLALSLWLVRRFGLVGVAWGTTIPLVLNKLLFVPMYTCRVIGLRPSRFYMSVAPTLVLNAAVLAALYTAIHAGGLPLRSYLAIGLATAVPLAALSALAYVCLLNRDERGSLTHLASTSLALRRSAA
jgi:O-antigen/teichoic acid export membrane protein